MKHFVALVVAAAVVVLPAESHAESFMGIGPKSRLQDVISLYPNARITDLKAAWLKPHQRLIDISGGGHQWSAGGEA